MREKYWNILKMFFVHKIMPVYALNFAQGFNNGRVYRKKVLVHACKPL